MQRKWRVIGNPLNLRSGVKFWTWFFALTTGTILNRGGANTTVQSEWASRNVANLLSNIPRTKNCISPSAEQGQSLSSITQHKSEIDDDIGALNTWALTSFASGHWESSGLSRKESSVPLRPAEVWIKITGSSDLCTTWGAGIPSQHSWRARRSSATRS